MTDENMANEQDARVIELLTEAAKRIDPRPGFDELSTRLLNMAFEIHQRLDPHCTCNDCLDEFERHTEPTYYQPHNARPDASGVCTVCNLAENVLHGVIDTEGDR